MVSLTCFGAVLLIQIIGLSEALFEGCDHTYNLNGPSVAYLLSPMYPNKYPSGSSCRYKLIVPLDYEIVTDCIINIDKNTNGCTTEFLYISRDGDSSLTGAEQTCGTGTLSRISLFRTLVIAYTSGASPGSGTGGKFNCTLTTRPQACDCGWSQSTRIVGGVETAIGEFPSMTALYNAALGRVFCGAAIISHRCVLSATHCVRLYPNVADLKLIVGDHDLTIGTESPYAALYDVSTYYESPGYDESNNANDIVILITVLNIEWSRGVGPICLPLDQLSNPFEYIPVDVVGWGTTNFTGSTSPTLQKANVNILPNSVCESVYPDLLYSQVCTFFPGRDSCQFDSGGPVVRKGSVREFLLGIISFGFACGIEPGVNTRVTSFIDWIQNRIPQGQILCPKPYN